MYSAGLDSLEHWNEHKDVHISQSQSGVGHQAFARENKVVK
jgi:hypothetical protein